MNTFIKRFIGGSILVLALAVSTLGMSGSVSAQSALDEACKSDSNSTLCKNDRDRTVGSIIRTVVNFLLYLVGVISVIMIIVGGIRYAVSGGDSGAVSAAKNTIFYAVIGLLIALFAFAIVNWVLGRALGLA